MQTTLTPLAPLSAYFNDGFVFYFIFNPLVSAIVLPRFYWKVAHSISTWEV